MSAKDLVEELRAEGALHRRGEFELDREKAREKLQKFQLSDPQRYVLELVQAAHILGARRIDFRIDTDEMEMTFDGKTFTEEDLEELYGAAFSRLESTKKIAMRHIAIGLIAAGAFDPIEMVIESGGPGRIRTMVYDPRTKTETISVNSAWMSEESFPLGGVGTRIYVRKPRKLSHVFDFLRLLQGDLAEITYLRLGCRYSGSDVFVGANKFSTGFPEPEEHVVIDTRYEKGTLRLLESGASSIDILQNGVLIDTHRPKSGPIEFHAVVESKRLTKDLSQSAFVKDQAWKVLVHQVLENARSEAILNRYERYSDTERASRHTELTQVMRALIEYRIKYNGQLSAVQKRLEDILAQHPMWFVADALDDSTNSMRLGFVDMVPLNAFKGHPLRVSKEVFRSLKYDEGPPVLLEVKEDSTPMVGPVDRRTLSKYLGQPVTLVTAELEAKRQMHANKARWEENVWSDVLSRVSYPSQISFGADEYQVHMGLSAQRPSEDRIQWVKNKRLLAMQSFKSAPIEGLRILVSGPIAPNAAWDGPTISEDYTRIAKEIAGHLPALMCDLARNLESHPNQLLCRRQLLRYIRELIHGRLHFRMLQELGVSGVVTEFLDAQEADSAWAIRIPASRKEADVRALDRIDGLGDVSRAPLLPLLGRPDFISLHEIALHLRDLDAKFPTIHKRHKRKAEDDYLASGDERKIVLSDDQTELILLRLFGNRFSTVKGELARGVNVKRFLRRPKASFELASEHLFAFHFKTEGYEIKAGLCSPFFSNERWIQVLLFHQDRQIDSATILTELGTFDCVARGSALNPRQDYEGILKDASRSKLESLIRAHVDDHLKEWMEKEGKGSPGRDFWELYSNGIGRKLAWVKELKVYQDLSGERLSFMDVNALATGRIAYVEGALEPLKSSVGEDELVLRSPNAAAAKRGFSLPWEDVNASEARKSAVEGARKAFLARPERAALLPDASGHVVNVPVTGNGVSGQIEMKLASDSVDLRELRAEILYMGRAVKQERELVPFGVFQAVVNVPEGGLRMDGSYTEIVVGLEDVRSTLRSAAEQAVLEFLNSRRSARDQLTESDWKLIHRFLMAVVEKREYCSEIWPQATRAIEDFPVFLWSDDTHISWADLRELKEVVYGFPHESIPHNVLIVMVWNDQTLRLIEQLNDLGRQEGGPDWKPLARAAALRLDVLDSLNPAESIPLVDNQDFELIEDESEELEARVAEPEVLTVLKQTLIQIRGIRRDLLSDGYVSQLMLDERDAAEPLVRKDGKRFFVNQNHPLAASMIATPSAPLLALFVSGVFTDLNRYERVITDQHEAVFQALVSEWLEHHLPN